MKFSQNDIDHIQQQITAAEKLTSAEIVVVVTEMSDDYKYVPLLWAALIALATPLPFFYFSQISGSDIYLLQLCLFCFLAVVFSFPFMVMKMVPNSLKRKRCRRRALEQFLAQNMHTTKGRTGILIYVSIAEKYCEIIADDGIYQKFDKEYWEVQVSVLSGHIGEGKSVEGFVHVIQEIGKQMATHFPAGEENPDELPNHIILL